MQFVILILFSAIVEAFCYIPLEKFYPYGTRYGDMLLPVNDDNSSVPINISMKFPFFGHPHGSIIVNTNGVLSFHNAVEQYTSDPFPISEDRRLVAPFWADVDTRYGGNVFYRESKNASILKRVSDDIKRVFPDIQNYRAKWALISTWDNVAFYGTSEVGNSKRNTFQAILTTDGRNSFAIFLYNTIEWTSGTASQGDADTGLGGIEAQVGFNAGDGVRFYSVHGSRTPAILNLTSLSNVHVPGMFVFRIDEEHINECHTSPCVHGICSDQQTSYICQCPINFTGRHCETVLPGIHVQLEEINKNYMNGTGTVKQKQDNGKNLPPWLERLEYGVLASIVVIIGGGLGCLCYRCFCLGTKDSDDDKDNVQKRGWIEKRQKPIQRPSRLQ